MALREQTQRLLSQEDVTADNVEEMYGVEGIDLPDITAKDVAMFAAESTPFLGEAIGIKRTSDALDEGDYVGAGIEGLATLAGVMPVAGDALAKGIRASANALRTPKWFKETKVDTDLAPDSSRKTQITTTTPTYRKVRDLLPEGKTLDFGSGKGVGARDVGFDTYEPFPDADFTPNYSSAKDISDESYENVTSLNVLNVVKPETRTEIVTDIGRILKPGGTAIITTRGADVFGNAKNPVKGVLGDEPGSVITSSGTYQKGFTQSELQEYVQETLGEEFEVVSISGAGQAGVKITKSGGLTAPRMGYDPSNTNSRVFHLTDADYDEINVVGSGTQDIGFHVGTAEQASARGSVPPSVARMETPSVREDYLESATGERIIPMVLKSDLKPARIVDMSSFAEPKNWLGNLAVAKTDRQRIQFLLGDQADADLLAKAPRVEVDGEFYFMLPDVMRTGMDENLWKDLITESHKAKRAGLDTKASQEDRIAWFNTLKQTANKNGYDSFVYRNEYEGTSEQNLAALVEQIQKANRGEIDLSEIDMNSRYPDSYMLLEPDQVKSIFGGMTEGDPNYMKNKGGLMLQKGGAIPMKEQMELFADGGLEQDGGTEDPVSGNDVPPGSTQEEVRDDIPAQLSEGEFVFPADVVRYIGLEKLMMMRQEAKMGLKMMDEMGQMGNSEEATMPDDLPFGVTDLIIVDGPEDVDNDEPKEYNVGGVVYGNQPAAQNTGVVYQQPQFQAGQTQVGMAATPFEMAPVSRPQQQDVPVYQPPETLPDPAEFVSAPEGSAPQTIVIVNKETGEERTITFIPGVTEIPQGFVRKEDYVPKEVVPETPTTAVETATVREESDGDEERRRQEEAMYGPGGGRLGFKEAGKDGKDLIFGVSFDTPEGFLPGVMGTAGLAAGLLSGKAIPADVTVNFKRGEIEFSMSGTEYNDLKSAINEFGSGSDEVKDKLNEYGLEKAVLEKRQRDFMEAQAEKMAKEARESELAKAREIADEKRRKAAVEAALEKQRQEAIAAAERERQYVESQGYQQDDDDDPGGFTVTDSSGQEYRTDSSGTAGAFTGGEVGMEDEYDFNTGGLAGKKKPKTKKKMKRGGLASKK